MFEIPILLITFNRPFYTKSVLSEIKKHKPKVLYIFQDGARIENSGDIEKCQEVKEMIENEVDWNCELITNYQNQNLGCGYGPVKAITWFFENVDKGIILEDDCLPSSCFFKFCEELLIKYENIHEVSIISGTNLLVNWKANKPSYLFSLFGNTWGWASWKRSWINFNHSMDGFNDVELRDRIKKFIANDTYYNQLMSDFKIYSNPERKLDVWDYQWYFNRLSMKTYSIVPSVNLISNIGFGEDANHTFDRDANISGLPILDLKFPLQYPKLVPDLLYDWIIFERYINPNKRSFIKKVILKIIKLIYGVK